MFLLTQFIGLVIVNQYSPTYEKIINQTTGEEHTVLVEEKLPFGMQSEGDPGIFSLIFSFVFAIILILILMKYKWKSVIRIWFFLVIILALSLALYAFIKETGISNPELMSLLIAVPLAALKIFKPTFLIHNLTELLIYPGIAAVFVPLLTPITAIIVLILISLYDAWAVWRSGIMLKMAKFQMEELRLFGGFFIPSLTKKDSDKIKAIKQKYKGKKMPESVKKRKFKVSLAILGGGDVIFPIITAGVFLRAYGIIPALFVIGGAFAGLSFLFTVTKKGKAYPAMPYITTGIFLALAIWKFLI